MSKNKTRHILAARYLQAEPTGSQILAANLETKKYVWAASTQEAINVLEGRDGGYVGSDMRNHVLGWVKGKYPSAFVQVVIG